MGSLLDGIDTTPAAQKSATASAADNGKKVKLALAVFGLIVAGVIIAWNLGMLDFGEQAPNSPAAAKSAINNATPPSGNGGASISSGGTASAPSQPQSGPRSFQR